MDPSAINFMLANQPGSNPSFGSGASNPMGAYMQAPPPMMPSAAPVVNPALGGMQSPFGMNIGTGQLALGAIGTIGNLWGAFQAQKLAQKQFSFQKDITETNLANSIKSYNTTLEDRIKARSFVQGDSNSDTDKYIKQNSLSR